MKKPILATKRITLTHCIREGTRSTQYTTELSRVSCHEAQGARAEAPGFATQSTTSICIFPGYSQMAPSGAVETPRDAGSTFLAPGAYKAADPGQRGCHWTIAPEDKVILPSGRTGTVTSVSDNRDGRTPHWYVEVGA